jgi:lysophospholipase L1-like esterase
MGFPVTFEEIYAKALKEGGLPTIELTGSGIAPVSGSIGISGVSLLPTQAFLLESVSFGLNNGKATAQLTSYSGPSNNSIGEVSMRVPLNNNSVTINQRQIITAGSVLFHNLRSGDGATSLNSSAILAGIRMTADFNFSAKKVIMWIGDSIALGSVLGGNSYSNYLNTSTSVSPLDHFAFQARNKFQTKGIDCRLVIKAMGSHTSKQMGYWIKQGWFDIDQCDVIFYQLGVNDSTLGTTDIEFTAEINRLIDFRLRKFPNAKIVLVGDTPLNNSTNETRLTQLRTIKSNFANATNKIYYLDLSTSFDRTILTNYTASDGVHPNIANNLLIGNTIAAWVDTNSFTF